MTTPISELFACSTLHKDANWLEQSSTQYCSYLNRKCLKTRKSQPEISIGTCSIKQSTKQLRDVIICPHRFLERGQVFLDCLHLLTLHEPGNQIHRVAEVEIPGGNIDYVLASVNGGKVVDFVGIELQALDTTGTLWPPRQQFLNSVGIPVEAPIESKLPYGINWKMTAKTTLVQLHHKIETFEGLGKHFVLVLQDALLSYMQQEFNFGHIQTAKLGHAMHFHSYMLQQQEKGYSINLANRLSTDAQGVASALGLQISANVDLEVLLSVLQSKLSSKTILHI